MRLSPFFEAWEFACHDGSDVPAEHMGNLARLVALVTTVRRAAGVPLGVISGWRSRSWNQRVGGAEDSTHLTAEGGDFQPGIGLTVPGLHALVLTMYRGGSLPELGGLGLYKGWVHLDVRKPADGHLRRWTGNGVGSER